MMEKEFSVVVPVYNRESLLPRCLDSVAAQSYRPIHLIIVDNGSTDGSLAVARSWASTHGDEGFRVTVVTEPEPGAPSARNRGLREVESDHMCFFDSDDAMRPQLAAEAMAAFRAHPEASIVTWKVCYHALDGKSFVMPFAESDYLTRNLLDGTMRTQGYAVLTSLVRQCGSWDSRAKIWNDWELGIRLLLASGERVMPLPCRTLADGYAQRESITGTDYRSKAHQIEDTLRVASDDLKSSPFHTMVLGLVASRISGRLRHEGEREVSRRLRREYSKGCPLLQKLIYGGVYLHTLLLQRGAARWALPLLRGIGIKN